MSDIPPEPGLFVVALIVAFILIPAAVLIFIGGPVLIASLF
jgi:hypothetical protein